MLKKKKSYGKPIMLGLLILAVLIILTILHPMLRTVERQTLTYDVVHFAMPERDITLAAANSAFAMWEKDNPELVFREGGGGMTIVFVPFPLLNVDGLAVCPFWNNSENLCYIFIPLYANDSYPFPYDIKKNIIANALAHEMGHVLGMMHSNIREHLMFGPVFGWDFNDRGFVIPERLGSPANSVDGF